MADDIAQWLEGLGLGQYAQAFTENAIDRQDVPHLTDDDLKDLGLPLGHRRRLQAAIGALSAGKPSDRLGEPSGEEPETQSGEAELRQLTVLFCDLVGSTALSTELDPEDMRELLRTYQDACSATITRYDGFVAGHRGLPGLAHLRCPEACHGRGATPRWKDRGAPRSGATHPGSSHHRRRNRTRLPGWRNHRAHRRHAAGPAGSGRRGSSGWRSRGEETGCRTPAPGPLQWRDDPALQGRHTPPMRGGGRKYDLSLVVLSFPHRRVGVVWCVVNI